MSPPPIQAREAAPLLLAQLLSDARITYQPQPRTLLGDSPQTSALRLQLGRLAASGANVLITGECGTGKHVVAAELHRRSDAAAEPIVAVDCAALSELLAEGALQVLPPAPPLDGLRASTVVLDEVGELDLRAQARLLRWLQQHPAERPAGLRLVATTSRDLQADVADGTFRADLYFRLRVVALSLAPLRQRREDIPALARHFTATLAAAARCPARDVSPAALDLLQAHDWPGNVRELENVIHQAVLIETSPAITPGALTLPARAPAEANPSGVPTSGRTIQAVEKDMILAALQHCRGRRIDAAASLGISVRTLRNKLHEYEREGAPIPPALTEVA